VPNYATLYRVSERFAHTGYRAHLDAGGFDPLDLVRGDTDAKPRLRFEWRMGVTTPGPAIWTTSAFPLIIQHGVVDALRKASLTGWSVREVEAADANAARGGPYYLLIVTGRCGPATFERSQYVTGAPRDSRPAFVGWYFERDAWDESDLFMESPHPDGKKTGFCFATDRARQVLSESTGGALEFASLATAETWCPIVELGMPSRLPKNHPVTLVPKGVG
jgi:hypothetical protein